MQPGACSSHAVQLVYSPAFESQTGGRSVFDVEPGTVVDIVVAFARRYPDNAARIITEDGDIHGFLGIYLDGVKLFSSEYAMTSAEPGSRLDIIPPVVGG